MATIDPRKQSPNAVPGYVASTVDDDDRIPENACKSRDHRRHPGKDGGNEEEAHAR